MFMNYIMGQITIDNSHMSLTKGAVIMIWMTLDVTAVLCEGVLEGDNCHLQGSTYCWPASLFSDKDTGHARKTKKELAD